MHGPDCDSLAGARGQEFDVVILLYSVPKNRRLRVKVSLADGEACPSVTQIWAGANWMEREVFDMFGIVFEGHPDLRRILLPEIGRGFRFEKNIRSSIATTSGPISISTIAKSITIRA